MLEKVFFIKMQYSIHAAMKKCLLFILLLIMTSCMSQSEKRPPYQLIFYLVQNVNDAAPLKVDVLFLKSKEEFMNSDFFSLQSNTNGSLGDKLVNEDQFFILPTKQPHILQEKSQPDIKYIGIIAEYSKWDEKKWRIALPAPRPEKPPFYKFWRSAPDKLQVCIKVTNEGLTQDLNCATWTEKHHE